VNPFILALKIQDVLGTERASLRGHGNTPRGAHGDAASGQTQSIHNICLTSDSAFCLYL